jgi:hypothetical protein
MGRTPWGLRALAGVVVALAVAGPASAQTPTLGGVSIVGDPIVGSPLQAMLAGTVDPSAVAYRWCHQRDGRADKCAPGPAIAESQTYVPVPGDVGRRLLVKVTAVIGTFTVDATSAPTAPVDAAQPLTVPPPTVPPPTAPLETTTLQATTGPAPTFASPGSTPAPAAPNGLAPTVVHTLGPASTPARAPYLNPFPVVRVRGFIAARGARVNLLRVTAPRHATVSVRCVGNRCPLTRRTRLAGRIRALERFLPAGLRITVRVTSPGHIGKYVRLIIRAGRPPARRDACVMPGRTRAVSCPPTVAAR